MIASQIHKYIYIIFTLFGLSLVLHKAITIPITYDETATAVYYINFSYLDIIKYPGSWPSNHILNTILVKFFVSLFGKEQWVVRLPSVLSFLIYCYATYLFCKTVFSIQSKLFLFGAVIFFLNFYLIDFFSLSRGYALSCAFLTLSVTCIIKSYTDKNDLLQWFGFLCAIFSSYANFTSLVYLISACISFVVYFVFVSNSNRKIITWNNFFFLLICVGYGALIITPIIKMKQDDQFKYWTSNGFINETMVSTVNCFKYASPNLESLDNVYVSMVIIGLVFFILFFWVYRILKHNYLRQAIKNPIFLSNSLLLMTAFISIANCIFTNTPYLNARTALFFYPMFSMLICSILSSLNKTNILLQLLSGYLILFFAVSHFKKAYRSDRVSEWWFDEKTFEVMKILRDDSQCKKIKLRTYWMFNSSFQFYSQTGKFNDVELSSYDKEPDFNSDIDYYYVMWNDLEKFKNKYYIVASFNNDERHLLKKIN